MTFAIMISVIGDIDSSYKTNLPIIFLRLSNHGLLTFTDCSSPAGNRVQRGGGGRPNSEGSAPAGNR